MSRSSRFVLAAVLGCAALTTPAQQPVDTGLQEQVQITLIQVDVVVTDKEGRTVPDLKKEDFILEIAGKPVPIVALDVLCPGGASDDPQPLRAETSEAPPPSTTGQGQRTVFAFDYTFLPLTYRPGVLEAAERMLRQSKAPDEEVMIVALAGEVRVEQRFTKDLRLLTMALQRMGHDVTLWARDFPIGVSGESYFQHVTTLMDVLESYDGPKAVVYFSQAELVPSSMIDLWYRRLAAHAAASRASIYPSKLALGGGPSQTLVRFANETGGRFQPNTNDLTLPYRRAQRDLACHYTIAARIDANERRDPAKLAVKLERKGLTLRGPETVQIFGDAEKRRSRAAAAYVDPGPYERPLVRAFAFPAVPVGTKRWDTLLAVSFPAPARAAGTDVDLRAVVRKEHRIVEEFKRKVPIDASPAGSAPSTVTILGNAKLTDGSHELTVVLADRAGEDIVAARTEFIVPQVPEDLFMLRGPVMGRVIPGGKFVRADKAAGARLGTALGEDEGFEPLLVQEVASTDEVLFYWSGCVAGRSPLPSDVIVERSVVAGSGETARRFDPIPLALEERGKGVACLDKLEVIPAGSLLAGDYRVEVTVLHPKGDVIAKGSEPLAVR